jgi:aspartate racemase
LLICPDNTVHQAFARVEARSPLPWIHIADVVADEAVARGFRRLGLTGTKWLVESDVYPERLTRRGLEYVRPQAAERDRINHIIFGELAYGVSSPDAVACFRQVIARMQENGCDGVVLGCTEIPLLMNDANSPLPTLDSTRLLARRATVRRDRLISPFPSADRAAQPKVAQRNVKPPPRGVREVCVTQTSRVAANDVDASVRTCDCVAKHAIAP